MPMTPLRLALFGAALIAGAPAFAQQVPPAAPAPAQRGPGGGMFRMMDANGDGRVTWDEAWTGVQQRFTAADANRDGAVTQEEALAARPPRRPERAERSERPEHAERVGRMFRGLDANRDGRVTLDEVRPMAESRFRAMDANGDQAVTQDEVPRHRHGPRQG